MSKELIQRLSVSEEVNIASRLITKGLEELQKIDGGNDFLHLPMLLLSNGLERLMKIILCLYYFELEESYMSKSELKKLGHNLTSILDKVIESCFDEKYLKMPAGKSDFDFLKNDKFLRMAIEILSAFSDTERYHNLDIIGGDNKIRGDKAIKDPYDDWGMLEFEIIKISPDWIEEIQKPFNDVSAKVSQELVKIFERCIRALSRLFTLGIISEHGKLYSSSIMEFINMMDKDIGKRNYSHA